MPQSVSYVAKRSLITGHVAFGTYTLDLPVRGKDRNRSVQSAAAVALSGDTFTTYYRGDTLWDITTRGLTITEARAMREFLDSVEGGQVFQFDPVYWSGNSPNDLRTVRLESKTYKENRMETGGDQTTDRFAFSFKLREV